MDSYLSLRAVDPSADGGLVHGKQRTKRFLLQAKRRIIHGSDHELLQVVRKHRGSGVGTHRWFTRYSLTKKLELNLRRWLFSRQRHQALDGIGHAKQIGRRASLRDVNDKAKKTVIDRKRFKSAPQDCGPDFAFRHAELNLVLEPAPHGIVEQLVMVSDCDR